MFIVSCSTEGTIINTEGIELNLEIKRLDSALFNKSSNLTNEDIALIKTDFGQFYNLFVSNIISVGRAEDSITLYYLNHFRNDPSVREIADQTQSQWLDLNDLELQFEESFKKYRVLFPNKTVPNIYTFISAFSYTIVVDDSLMGIGLDMYLGKDNNFYQRLGIPAYKRMSMSKEYIVSECMKSWVSTEFEFNSESSDLLSNMIYHGKLLYALDLLLPETEDSIKMAYTNEQMKWMRDNEKDVWFHFANQEIFYSKESKLIQNFIGEGPFTPGFPEGSPGRVGRWVGWQIIRKYMKQNNPFDLEGLFNENNAQKILSASKYKPN